MKHEAENNLKPLDFVVDHDKLLPPLNPSSNSNYMPSFVKAQMFLNMLDQTKDACEFIREAFLDDEGIELDENGILRTPEDSNAAFMARMKPIDDCEAFLKKYPFNYWDLALLIERAKAMGISATAQSNAYKRLQNDTKQSEKSTVRECWDLWQANPTNYKSKTKFAQAMIEKFRPENPEDEEKHLNSVQVITNWCREWEKEKSQSAS